jgi:hypothetical protein
VLDATVAAVSQPFLYEPYYFENRDDILLMSGLMHASRPTYNGLYNLIARENIFPEDVKIIEMSFEE